MSQDSFTVTSSTGWFSRIGGAIKGILFGALLIVISFPVLFINEGRAVKTRKSLEEGAGICLSIPPDVINPANDGKLIHLTGITATPGTLADPQFNVTAPAIHLRRTVEIHQWTEKSKSETRKKLGGGEETVTTYTYQKEWSDEPVDSSKFQNPAGHENPKPALDGASWTASPVTLGAFTLSPSLVAAISDFTQVNPDASIELPDQIAGMKPHRQPGGLYLGADPANPAIGDLRVTHQAAMPGTVSLIARQSGATFEPFTTTVGGTIEMLVAGTQSKESMFAAAQASNKALTWGLRLLGSVLMFIGFTLVFRPLSVLADVIPFVGSIVGAGTGIIAFLLTVPLSLVTISIAWIFYRPLIGVPLLLAAVAGFVLLFRKLAARRSSVTPHPASAT